MRKLLLFVFAVNLILLISVGAQNAIYKEYLVPRLVWAVDTLNINFMSQRDLYLTCKKHMVSM